MSRAAAGECSPKPRSGSNDVQFCFRRSLPESINRECRDVQRVRLPIENLFGNQLPHRRSVLESVSAEAVCQNEIGEAGNTSENGMSVRRRLIATRPGILDCGVGDWREPVNRNFHHFVEELPVNAHIEGWGFLSIPHSQQHSSNFAMKVKTAREVNNKRPT